MNNNSEITAVLKSSDTLRTYYRAALIFAPLFLALITASCAKSPSGVRTIKQTAGNTVNAATSNQSVQAAVSQNLYYEMVSVSRPNENVQVSIEVKTPTGMYLPITTDHSSSREAYGIYTDDKNGAQLEFRARCSDESCSKYTMLMTVVKGAMAYHQTAVVSYRHACRFNLENINAAVSSNLYRTLDAIETKFANSGVVEETDCQGD